MTTITTIQPAPVAPPRGAAWAAEAAHRLTRMFAGWRLRGHATSVRESRVAEANAVRRLADDLHRWDPRSAADLYAAADRHERT